MKNTRFKWGVATMFFALISFSSYSQLCVDFQDTSLTSAVPTTQTTFGATWYNTNGYAFRSRYFDYDGLMFAGSVAVSDHVAAGYTGANGSSNYAGNIFYQGNVITEINFSSFPTFSKTVEFDVNYIYNDTENNPYWVNGQPMTSLPAGVTYTATPLANGFHVVLTGDIQTIEIRGFEVGLDNLCVDSLLNPPPPAVAGCIFFDDTALFNVPISQSSFGTAWYTDGGYEFRSKYFDYDGLMNAGSVSIFGHVAAGYTGSNGNSNFVSNILYQGNAITQIDFSAFQVPSKTIEFDVNYINNDTENNPYFVNGQPMTTLPAGVTYTATPLANGFHIVLTGDIQTIEINGFEVGLDNLCIDSLLAPPPTVAGCIHFDDTSLYMVPISQSTFGTAWYTDGGYEFRSKYFDYDGLMNAGSVSIFGHVAAGYTGSNGNSNFVSNILYQGNAITQIDFSAFQVPSKTIEFDVNYINNDTENNPYFVNGQPMTTLPAGVTYTATPLVNGFHIVLTGDIQTIEINGFEVGLDNLCIQENIIVVTPPPPSNPQIVISPNGDGNNDEVSIPSGAKIFDRNGFLVAEPTQNIQWQGTDDSSRPLPMGYYTVYCLTGEVFHVTVIR